MPSVYVYSAREPAAARYASGRHMRKPNQPSGSSNSERYAQRMAILSCSPYAAGSARGIVDSVSPSSPPLSPSTAQPMHRGQTPMSPHDPIQPHPPRTTADCIGQPPPKGPSALSPEVTLRSIDGVGLSTSHGDDRSKQVTTGDDRKQNGNPRLIHRAMI